MKKICKNCSHYKKNNECYCDKFFVTYENVDLEKNKDCVQVESDEGWGFVVGEEFGCIHFNKLK